MRNCAVETLLVTNYLRLLEEFAIMLKFKLNLNVSKC